MQAVAVAAHQRHLFRARPQHHGRQHVAVVGMLGQCVVDRFVQQRAGIDRQIDELLRAAPRLAPLEIHQAFAQRLVRRRLVRRDQRGVDLEAARVAALTVLRDHLLAHRLGHVLGMQPVRVGRVAQVQRFGLRFGGLRGADDAGLPHAVEHIQLAGARTARIDHRVVGGRCLGQPGQHRRLGERDVLQRPAEVGFRRRRETVGAMAQVDLVQVDLEDLVLRELVLEPVREQRLIGLARQRALGTQVDVARHLHRDGGGALVQAVPQVGQGSAQQPLGVDAAVLVEARVFHREHRVFHRLRDVGDRREGAALFAELADQHTFRRVHAQRQLGPVIGQRRHVGQLRVDHRQRHATDAQQHSSAGRRRRASPQGDALAPARSRVCCGSHRGNVLQ